MERDMGWFCKLVCLGSLMLILLSIYPGVLVDAIVLGLLSAPLWLSALGLVCAVGLAVQSRARKKAVRPDAAWLPEDVGGVRARGGRWWWALAPLSVALSFALVLSGLPVRAAFSLSLPAFRRHVATAPISEYEGEELGRLLGLYHVDRHATDPRGGTYFRTHSGSVGIGPDTMSYGFAHRPNEEGSPFGNSKYNLSHMAGDWHRFSASNDW
jgi:hypothetical protein